MVGTIPANLECFWLQRYFLKDCIHKHIVKKMRVIKAVERSININGLKILVFLRLQPIIPKTIINLIVACTSSSTKDFALSIIIASTPYYMVFCYIGIKLNSLQQEISGSRESSVIELVFSVIITVLMIIGLYFLSRESKK